MISTLIMVCSFGVFLLCCGGYVLFMGGIAAMGTSSKGTFTSVGPAVGRTLEAKMIPQPPAPPDVPGKTTVDLIPLVRPAQDAVDNRKWKVSGNVLLCDDDSFVPRLALPYQPPEEYDFVVTFSQPELRNGISLIMPNPKKPGESFFWAVGADEGAEYWLSYDPERKGHALGLVKVNKAYTTVVQVRRDGLRCFLNGKELVHHRTNYSDLTCDGWRKIPDTRLLAVACDDPTVFHYVRVIEISGPGKKTR
jgi:hypothetical protein